MEEIKKFWLTWKEIIRTKKEARSKLSEASEILDRYNKVFPLIEETNHLLSELYYYLPLRQRKDYIQKTLDLLTHGIIYEYNSTGDVIIRKLPESFLTHLNGLIFDLKGIYSEMKDLMKFGEYQDVIDKYKDFTEALDILKSYINEN